MEVEKIKDDEPPFECYTLKIRVMDKLTDRILKDIFVLDYTLPKELNKIDGHRIDDVANIVKKIYHILIDKETKK